MLSFQTDELSGVLSLIVSFWTDGLMGEQGSREARVMGPWPAVGIVRRVMCGAPCGDGLRIHTGMLDGRH